MLTGKLTQGLTQLLQHGGMRYLISVGAQALVSGFHFILNLLLLRELSQYDYGVFAFAFVLALFAAAINNALISTPLSVFTPVITDDTDRHQSELMLGSVNLLFTAALLLTGVLYALVDTMALDLTLSVALFVACYSARQFSRSFGYTRMKPLFTALGDITYVVTGTIFVAFTLLKSDSTSTSQMLVSLAAANGVAMLIERLMLHGTAAFRFNVSTLPGYRHIWLQSRWALIGAVTTLLIAQAHSLIVTSTVGPDAFAPLAAGFVLFGPVRVALLTWQNMVKPEMAVALSRAQHAVVRSQIRNTTLYMVLALGCFGAALYGLWPWIHESLYAVRYSDEPMALIVGIWFITTIAATLYNAPSAGLQALRDFRILAIGSVMGAIISLVGVVGILQLSTPAMTLFATLAAELFLAGFLLVVIHRKLSQPVTGVTA